MAIEEQKNTEQTREYFNYIKNLKKMHEKGIDNVNEALEILSTAINTRHIPDRYAINYILAHQRNTKFNSRTSVYISRNGTNN